MREDDEEGVEPDKEMRVEWKDFFAGWKDRDQVAAEPGLEINLSLATAGRLLQDRLQAALRGRLAKQLISEDLRPQA